jgi:hypothetical protein
MTQQLLDEWSLLTNKIRKEFEEKERFLLEKEKEIQKFYLTSQKFQKSVKLNIGGTIFETTKETLTSVHSLFTPLLSEQFKIELDQNGAIFIDRDPTYFSTILNYMRNPSKPLITIAMNEKEIACIKEEIDFYQIESLMLEDLFDKTKLICQYECIDLKNVSTSQWIDKSGRGYHLNLKGGASVSKNGLDLTGENFHARGSVIKENPKVFTLEGTIKTGEKIPHDDLSNNLGGGFIIVQPGLFYLEQNKSLQLQCYCYGASSEG